MRTRRWHRGKRRDTFGVKDARCRTCYKEATILPLLRKRVKIFSFYSVKAEMVVVAPQPFSPNLFYSASLVCPTYLMQAEKAGGVDQAESYRPSAYEELRSFFHHNHSLCIMQYAAMTRAPSSNFLLSLKSAKITLMSFIATAQRISFLLGC